MEEVYKDCKLYGPYNSGKDGRLRCVIAYPNGRKQTLSYPKYLIEKHLNAIFVDPTNIKEFLTITGHEDRSITITAVAIINEQEQNVAVTINNNLIYKMNLNEGNILTYKYNEEANEIPQIPTDVIWTVDDYTLPRLTVSVLVPTVSVLKPVIIADDKLIFVNSSVSLFS